MRRFFQRIILWLYIKYRTLMFWISLSLYNTENEILKAGLNDLTPNATITQRMIHRNRFIEMMLKGVRDEKLIKSYYEVLKKADEFIKTATPHKMAVAADKHHTNYGMKDRYGRRYEHYGFFDDKHKHAGKTLGEVLAAEFEERKTKDDDLEILYIFNNKPIETGFSNIMDVLEEPENKNVEYEYEVVDIHKKSKQFVFPIKAYRENENIVNKIEQLTEYLHIKKIAFEYRQLEFFIPLKYKTDSVEENSDIFNEIINFTHIVVKNDYGEMMGFKINKFLKRIKHNDIHEVWKFEGIEMQNVGIQQ